MANAPQPFDETLPIPTLFGRPRSKQFPFVESPQTVLMVPVRLDDEQDWKWWSYDGVLLGGIKVNGIGVETTIINHHSTAIPYLPTPIPRSWDKSAFHVVVEYEAEVPEAHFAFQLFYGCGDPSELRRGESEFQEGATGGKRRMQFKLNETYLNRNELFRCSIDVMRKTPAPVLIYGVWLEVGV